MTNEELKSWTESDDFADEVHEYFEKWGRWDLGDIADEAERLMGAVLDLEIERDSPISAVIHGAVAQAEHSAYAAMAAALGVDASVLSGTVAKWSEHQDDMPPPVTAARLMEMVEETRQEFIVDREVARRPPDYCGN
jgi:hypothetical protein